VAALLGAGLMATMGCSTERDPATLFAPDAVDQLVLDAVLVVDQPLPAIRLSRTQVPDAPYDVREANEDGASIVIRVGELEIAYVAAMANERTFYFNYVPAAPPPLVLPLTRYEIEVTTNRGEVLTATTTTPNRIVITEWMLLANDGQTDIRALKTFAEEGDNVYSHPDNQLTYAEGLLDARYAGLDASVFGAAGFQLALFSLDPDAGFVIDPPFLEDEDFADLPRTGASPALNGNDGYVRLPWFSIFYDSRYLYKAYAVDANWFDLIRTTPEGGGSIGFGGNIGDGVDPPLFRIEGGIGLFGSASVDSVGFFITPIE
jgi:hypothetical protein